VRIRSLRLASATLDPKRFPKSPWREVAVSGRSNVGKSSLLNTLFDRKNLARISKDPGKTRSINFYAVNDRFYLVDLPGYGYAKVSLETRAAWTRVMTAYLEKRAAVAGVVQLIDSRHAPTKDDLTMMARLIESARPFIVVFTKADKVSKPERARVASEFRKRFADLSAYAPGAGSEPGGTAAPGLGEGPAESGAGPRESRSVDVEALFFSSRTGEGKEALWRWILERVEGGAIG